jgi:hypothetical protein
MAAEWTPHSCDICVNLDPIKVNIFLIILSNGNLYLYLEL